MSENTTPSGLSSEAAFIISIIEDLEKHQINFGIVNTHISFNSLAQHKDVRVKFNGNQEVIYTYLIELKQKGELLEIAPNIFRSRITETTRNLRLLRQRFFHFQHYPKKPQEISKSKELIDAVRTEFRTRSRPKRDQLTISDLINPGDTNLDETIRKTLIETIEKGLGWTGAAGFQGRAFKKIYELSNEKSETFPDEKTVIVAGDTGSGKTEAFLFPIMARLAQRKLDLANLGIESGVGAVLVYPRIALALNQLERIARLVKLWNLYSDGEIRLTIGIQNTVIASSLISDYLPSIWKAVIDQKNRSANRTDGLAKNQLQMPLMNNPFKENAKLVFAEGELGKADNTYPKLVSPDGSDWQTLGDKRPFKGEFDQLLVTRSALRKTATETKDIPDILIITDKSLNLYLSQPEYQHLWGTWLGSRYGKKIAPPQFLVLDEIHLYNGLPGAHLSRLISRFQARVHLASQKLELGSKSAVTIAVSATLYDEQGFMAKFLGKNPVTAKKEISVCKPEKSEMVSTEGRERYIFVKPHEVPNPEDPEKKVGGMEAAIQIVMASMHNLMPTGLGEKFGYKGLAFFDSLNDVNLFYKFYCNPANNTKEINPGANTQKLWSIRTDYHICELTGKKCNDQKQYNRNDYEQCSHFRAGDCWVFAYKNGWNKSLYISEPKFAGSDDVELTKTHLIPTTASMEVGYDDDTIQLVYQHRAPNNIASFIQRRGRAGRNPNHSPVIVTMLWPYRARDLFYFYRPDYLYNPTFDDIPLNSRNRYVQIMHAFLAIFDWLAAFSKCETNSLPSQAAINYASGGEIYRHLLMNNSWRDVGKKVLNNYHEEIKVYLESQTPALAKGVIEETLELFREKFYSSVNHRIVSRSDSLDYRNLLGSFKYIDLSMQGDSGGDIAAVYYPAKKGTSRELSSSFLDHALVELVPGNVSYRLRISGESHWTPINKDGESTYSYSTTQTTETQPKSLRDLKDSLMGIPKFLIKLYPDLQYFQPNHLLAQRFDIKGSAPQWVYNIENNYTLPLDPKNKDIVPTDNNEWRSLNTHSQAFTSSLVIPYAETGQPDIILHLPNQLDKIFESIGIYTDTPLSYLKVLYEYTISPKLRPLTSKDRKNINCYPKLHRLFYGIGSTPENPRRQMPAYDIKTQGLQFNVSKDFCNGLVKRVLASPDLRMHYRQRYVAYRLAKEMSFLKPASLPLYCIQLARLLVAYWLAKHVPLNFYDSKLWEIEVSDLDKIRKFAQEVTGDWSGEQSVQVLFEWFKDVDEKEFVEKANYVIEKGFTNSLDFVEFLESITLHSLAMVTKNHCAFLGGVSSDELVVYADLPEAVRVADPPLPRILVMDSVNGGSGAIQQAYENLTRRVDSGAADEIQTGRTFWDLLQVELGVCPVGDGEDLLRRFMLSFESSEFDQFIHSITKSDNYYEELKSQVLENKKLVISDKHELDKETFATLARVIFAPKVYTADLTQEDEDEEEESTLNIPNNEINNDSSNPDEGIESALLVYELVWQEKTLENQLGYRPQPEIVVAQALNANSWPNICIFQTILETDLKKSGKNAEKRRLELRKRLTGKLLELLPRRCEDGCPVCMVSGSDMESRQYAAFLNSRLLLREARNLILVEEVQTANLDTIAQTIVGAKPFRTDQNTAEKLVNNLKEFAEINHQKTMGVFSVDTVISNRSEVATTFIPIAKSFETNSHTAEFKYQSLLGNGDGLDSRGEAMIAHYLDLHCLVDNWNYNREDILLANADNKYTRLKPDFSLSIPIEIDGNRKFLQIIIEYWGLAGNPDYDNQRSFKEQLYDKNDKNLIAIENEDLYGHSFVEKIEEQILIFAREQSKEAVVKITSLEDISVLLMRNSQSTNELSKTTPPNQESFSRETIPTPGTVEVGKETEQLEKYLTPGKVYTFRDCGLKGVLNDRGDIVSLQSVEAFISDIVHPYSEEVGRFIKGEIKDLVPPVYSVEDWKLRHQKTLLNIRPWTLEEALHHINNCLKNMFTWAAPNITSLGWLEVLLYDEYLEKKINNKVKVKIRPDLILARAGGKEILVIDWKTSVNKNVKPNEISATYYALLILSNYPNVQKVSYQEYYLPQKTFSDHLVYTPSDITKFEQQVLDDAKNITKARKETTPKLATHCLRCSYSRSSDYCPQGNSQYPPNPETEWFPVDMEEN